MDMHRLMGRILLTLPMAAMALPMQAEASLDLLATITKDKDIEVTQTVDITKNIEIRVRLEEQYGGAAEADAVSNQLNLSNDVRGNIADGADDSSYGITRHALILDSINGNSGIVGVNQDVGNMVNQANVVSVALTTTPAEGPLADGTIGMIGSITNSQAEADQINRDNNLLQHELTDIEEGPNGLEIVSPPDQRAEITGSINGNSGALGINQNTGNMNNQLNKLALAIGPGSHVALSEAALGQVNSGNRSEEVGTHRHSEISGSVNGNSGIVGVNQSSGSMNNQASVVSMAVLTSSVAITTP